MGGGDLNMKKSWHPLLIKNQERVWLEEKKALEEKKKLDQLRKEKEEERQMQELQRLAEEKTGKKRAEKLEWMYSTPATGSGQNSNDMEDYLLGKKRVDKILTADENAKLGATHKNFIAVQNANTVRDIASKLREDPLFAIKQQEQATLQALMANPLRLREMQERNGIKPKEKRDKKEKKREKREQKEREQKERRGRSDSRSRSRSSRRSPQRYRSRSRSYERNYDKRSRSPSYRRSASPRPKRDRSFRHRDDSPPRHDRSPRSRTPERDTRFKRERNRSLSPSRDRYEKRARYSPKYQDQRPMPPPPQRQVKQETQDDRAARLAAMSSNANTMNSERQKRLTALLEKEKAELEQEERMRVKSKGMGGFLSNEQKKVFGGVGGLEDRIKRGRGGMVSVVD